MRMEIVPERATNADLAKLLVQLHECVEDHKRVTSDGLEASKEERRSLRAGQLEMAKKLREYGETQDTLVYDLGSIAEKQSGIAGQVRVLTEAFGLKPDETKRKHKPIAFMSQTEVVVKVGASAATLIFLWKFILFWAPWAWHFLIAMNEWVQHGA